MKLPDYDDDIEDQNKNNISSPITSAYPKKKKYSVDSVESWLISLTILAKLVMMVNHCNNA